MVSLFRTLILHLRSSQARRKRYFWFLYLKNFYPVQRMYITKLIITNLSTIEFRLFPLKLLTQFFTVVIQDTGLYMIIVLPLRKSSFRKMIKERHNNRQINLTVLESLKPIVCGGWYHQHGDLKEKCYFKNIRFQTNIDNTI